MVFGVGASISQVCKYCRTVVVRTDRDFKNLGKAADLANTPSSLAVGDRGEVRGRQFEVMGRVQLDYGRGPWDEFYLRFLNEQWGWIAEAQGNLYLTQKIAEKIVVPPPQSVAVESSIVLGRYGAFKVVERRTAKVLTAEGELPFAPSPQRFYLDCHGPGGSFATVDYNDGTKEPEVFVGVIVPLGELKLAPRGGERPGTQKVALTEITCKSCGGKLPPPKPGIERVACKYCGAISDSNTLAVLARQAASQQTLKIPLGTQGTLGGTQYTCIGFCRRAATVEGEYFSWEEYLLWSATVGFRWVMLDEGNWLFVNPLSVADVTCNEYQAIWHGRTFQLRNRNDARVEYVQGEFYWKVEVGETVAATDFIAGSDILSREKSKDEVSWSYCSPVSAQVLSTAFGVQIASTSGYAADNDSSTYYSGNSNSGGSALSGFASVVVIIIVLVCLMAIGAFGEGGGGSYSSGGGGYSGSSSFGGFGGK
jgi:hypothetical protein